SRPCAGSPATRSSRLSSRKTSSRCSRATTDRSRTTRYDTGWGRGRRGVDQTWIGPSLLAEAVRYTQRRVAAEGLTPPCRPPALRPTHPELRKQPVQRLLEILARRIVTRGSLDGLHDEGGDHAAHSPQREPEGQEELQAPLVGPGGHERRLEDRDHRRVADLRDPGLLERLNERRKDLLAQRHGPLESLVLEEQIWGARELPVRLHERLELSFRRLELFTRTGDAGLDEAALGRRLRLAGFHVEAADLVDESLGDRQRDLRPLGRHVDRDDA